MPNIPADQCECGGAFEYHEDETDLICRYSQTCGCEGYEEDQSDYHEPYTAELAQSHIDQHQDGTPDRPANDCHCTACDKATSENLTQWWFDSCTDVKQLREYIHGLERSRDEASVRWGDAEHRLRNLVALMRQGVKEHERAVGERVWP
jgi:hypothetical protein